jgi:hypothetical protein
MQAWFSTKIPPQKKEEARKSSLVLKPVIKKLVSCLLVLYRKLVLVVNLFRVARNARQNLSLEKSESLARRSRKCILGVSTKSHHQKKTKKNLVNFF